MINQDNFLITTDLDTLAGNPRVFATITFPGSTAIPSGGMVFRTIDVSVSDNSLTNIRYETSKIPGRDYLASTQQSFERNGSNGVYSVFIVGYHISRTIIRLEVQVPNLSGVNFTSEPGDEIFTFKLRPIVDPFS